MKHHPEQQDDEIYMGNSTTDGIQRSSWRTSRLGITAIGHDGKPLGRRGRGIGEGSLQPWFIKASEVQQTIESERTAAKPWSNERIRTLQPMLDQRTCFIT